MNKQKRTITRVTIEKKKRNRKRKKTAYTFH